VADAFDFDDDAIEKLATDLMNHEWIPRVNEIARTMKGAPRAEVLQALEDANTATVSMGEDRLEEWATIISEGRDFSIHG
jgi:1,2-phenylacetyl-CoA epoxidase catalytic subunit